MVGIGTIVNVIVIIVCGIIGLVFKQRLKQNHHRILKTAIGLSTLFIGLSGALEGLLYIEEGQIKTQYQLQVLIFLIIGGLIGSFFRLSDRLDGLGRWIKKRFGRGDDLFSQGFVTATLIFCIGAMAIIGAIRDGINGDPTLLYLKAILDGITSIVLASSFGIGVLFAAIPVFLYQMSITIFAFVFGNFLPMETRVIMNIIGNILIVGLSFNILEMKKIDVVNLLPAVFIPLIYLIL